jgi:hypothetical protein
MSHIYVKPENVLSPRDCVEIVKVIYEDNAFSIADILWDDVPRIGVRWNIAQREWDDPIKASGKKECVGMPSSRGYPVWFVMPEKMLDPQSEIWKKIQETISER